MSQEDGERRSVLIAAIHGRPGMTRAIDGALAILIVLNVLATILETVASIEIRFGAFLKAFDTFSVVVFTIEYVIRLALAPTHPSGLYRSPVRGRLRFALTPLALVDLAAILPFYLATLTTLDLRFLRAFRLFRIFKLTRYSASMSILLGVLREEVQSFAAAFFILIVVLVCAASGIYFVEREAQPEAFASIPAAMWWAVATLTTVGYGDVTPITNAGKLFGAVVTIIGIGMVALPAGILASGFSDHLRRRRESFRLEVEHAFEDGRLSEGEGTRLEEMREELGLAKEEADQVVATTRDAAAAAEKCPHCGKALQHGE